MLGIIVKHLIWKLRIHDVLATYLQFHIMRDYNHCRLSDKIGLRWRIGFPNNYHFLVSRFQDKVHLLGDIFKQFL